MSNTGLETLFEGELNFIVPPKANRYFKGRNGHFIPERIKEAIDDAILILSTLKPKNPIEEYCQLYVVYTFPNKRKRDLDNLNKSLQDCLEKAGIIKDDKLFQRTISEKRYQKGIEKTQILIYPISQTLILPSLEVLY